jgi:hypothetical protein
MSSEMKKTSMPKLASASTSSSASTSALVKATPTASRQVYSKQDLLLLTLREFFNDKKNLQKMLKILRGESDISLRILDWFTTNYSKKYNISYDRKNSKFIVYLDYKSQLKAYSKKEFDPFCRRERIMFKDKDNNEFATTVGQLNFFRWAIENKVLEYVEENFPQISKDMNQSIHHLYRKGKKKGGKEKETASSEDEHTSADEKGKGKEIVAVKKKKVVSLPGASTSNEEKEKEKEAKRNKRKELSISATKTVNKHNVKIMIQFE